MDDWGFIVGLSAIVLGGALIVFRQEIYGYQQRRSADGMRQQHSLLYGSLLIAAGLVKIILDLAGYTY